MPTYLCHGFRWHRPSIRVFVIVQDVEDAAPDWIIAPGSSAAILESFYSLFDFLPEPQASPPTSRRSTSRHASKTRKGKAAAAAAPGGSTELSVPPSRVAPEDDEVLSNDWSCVKLLEEYDPANLEEMSRPYAFVADHVVRVDLDVSVAEEIGRYEERFLSKKGGGEERPMAGPQSDEFVAKGTKGSGSSGGGSGKKAGWFEKLRDQLQMGEDIRWYVVVCGDEERLAPGAGEEIERPRMESVSGSSLARAEEDGFGERERGGQRGSEREPAPLRGGDGGRMGERGRGRGGSGDGGEYFEATYQPGGLANPDNKAAKPGGLRRLFGKKGDES